MILNSALYWVLFAAAVQNNTETTQHKKNASLVVLIFIPTTLMSLDYAMLYLQLDDMQKRSRVQGATQYIDQNKHEKLVKFINIVTFAYVFIFIGI